jgi:hypothetical protein
MIRTSALAIVLTTMFWAAPADAATPSQASSVASGSLGARREVAYFGDDGWLYLQHLAADGSPDGSRIAIDRSHHEDQLDYTVTGPLSVAVGNGGTAIVASHRLVAGNVHREGAAFYFVDDEDTLAYAYTHCFDENSSNSGFGEPGEDILPGTVAWNGSVFRIAGGCDIWEDGRDTYIRTATFDPVTHEYTGSAAGPEAAPRSISIAPLGAAFALTWQARGAVDNLDVFAQRYSSSGSPTSPVHGVATGAGAHMQPTIAGSGGRYLVAWIEGSGRDVAGRALSSTGLGAKRVLVNAAGNQNHPWLAPSSNGGWHLAWADLRSGNNDVYSAKVSSTLGVSPANGQVVAGGPGPQVAPAVSPLPNGRGFVAYLDQGVAEARDLTVNSAPTGDPKTLSVSPK